MNDFYDSLGGDHHVLLARIKDQLGVDRLRQPPSSVYSRTGGDPQGRQVIPTAYERGLRWLDELPGTEITARGRRR